MSYEKPKLVAMVDPLRAIQGNCKTSSLADGHISANDATAAGYESDE